MDNGASSYRRFLEGDERAFDEIVDSLFYPLVFFLNGYVHDSFAAEDLAMDTISDLFVNKKRYNFQVSLKTYVFMIGKSKALNYLKRRNLIRFVEFSENEGVSSDEKELEELVLADEPRCTYDMVFRYRQYSLCIIITTSRLRDRSMTGVAKKLGSLK